MVVYALQDPDTLEIRYIGKTVRSLRYRLTQHVSKRELAACHHRACWLRSLGRRPVITALVECQTEEELGQAEILAIAFARDIGLRLTNSTDGGDGASGKPMPAHLKEKLRKINSRPCSAEKAEKIAAPQRGVPKSAEARAKMSAAKKGKPLSEAHRAALRRGHARRRAI